MTRCLPPLLVEPSPTASMDLFSRGIATLAAFRLDSLFALRGDSGTRNACAWLGDIGVLEDCVVGSGDSTVVRTLDLDLLESAGGGGWLSPSPGDRRRPDICWATEASKKGIGRCQSEGQTGNRATISGAQKCSQFTIHDAWARTVGATKDLAQSGSSNLNGSVMASGAVTEHWKIDPATLYGLPKHRHFARNSSNLAMHVRLGRLASYLLHCCIPPHVRAVNQVHPIISARLIAASQNPESPAISARATANRPQKCPQIFSARPQGLVASGHDPDRSSWTAGDKMCFRTTRMGSDRD